MYNTEKFKSPSQFIQALKVYIMDYNEERFLIKLKGMTLVQYHHHSLISTI